MEDSKPVSTPGTSEEKVGTQGEDEEKEMKKADATRYRRATARINYLAQDRPDLSFAAKELSRSMAKPNEADTVRLKRTLRYLKGTPRMGIMYKWQLPDAPIKIFTDSDWAGCQKTRRSTSGGMAMKGGHLLTHWASTQTSVALSSGEAELNGAVKAGSEALGIMNLHDEMGLKVAAEILTDSSAANGIVHRVGCGKVKHLEARQLWIQEAVQSKKMKVTKVPRKLNPSDCLTHHYLAHEGSSHFSSVGLRKIECGLAVQYASSLRRIVPPSLSQSVSPRGGVGNPRVSYWEYSPFRSCV